jgi:hypothetical protein
MSWITGRVRPGCNAFRGAGASVPGGRGWGGPSIPTAGRFPFDTAASRWAETVIAFQYEIIGRLVTPARRRAAFRAQCSARSQSRAAYVCDQCALPSRPRWPSAQNPPPRVGGHFARSVGGEGLSQTPFNVDRSG